jgi:hypothetical protein
VAADDHVLSEATHFGQPVGAAWWCEREMRDLRRGAARSNRDPARRAVAHVTPRLCSPTLPGDSKTTPGRRHEAQPPRLPAPFRHALCPLPKLSAAPRPPMRSPVSGYFMDAVQRGSAGRVRQASVQVPRLASWTTEDGPSSGAAGERDAEECARMCAARRSMRCSVDGGEVQRGADTHSKGILRRGWWTAARRRRRPLCGSAGAAQEARRLCCGARRRAAEGGTRVRLPPRRLVTRDPRLCQRAGSACSTATRDASVGAALPRTGAEWRNSSRIHLQPAIRLRITHHHTAPVTSAHCDRFCPPCLLSSIPPSTQTRSRRGSPTALRACECRRCGARATSHTQG